jgi:selenocysteine lyase/cysteine desulfurase
MKRTGIKIQSISTQWKYPPILGDRNPVPLLDGRKVSQIFLDNAASTKPFQATSEFLNQIQPYYSNIHRGTGFDSMFCTERYELARRIVGEFVNYNPDLDAVIPVRNTTEGMNLLANTIALAPDDRVLTTLSEHHSNDLPWRNKAIVEHLPIDYRGHLDLQLLEQRLISANGKVRIVSVTGASNVLGAVMPIHEIAEIVHRHGALIVVDGAQLVPHRQVDMHPHESPSHIDFLVFSGHKMNCPYGVGAVIGKKALFDAATPYQPGGGTVYSVNVDEVVWADAPERNEAGTPNILGLMALAETIEILKSVGMKAIESHERQLTTQLVEGLNQIPEVKIFGDLDKDADRVGVVSFNVTGVHHALVAAILSFEWGIAVRNGCFCAHPLIKHLLNVSPLEEEQMVSNIQQGDWRNVPGAVRASLGIHNTPQDIVTLVEALTCISRQQWQGVYQQDRSTGEFVPQGFEFDFTRLPNFGTQPIEQLALMAKQKKENAVTQDYSAFTPKKQNESSNKSIFQKYFSRKSLMIGVAALAAVGSSWFWLRQPSRYLDVGETASPIQVFTPNSRL